MKCSYEKEKATMFTLRINKPVQEYALDFLNIFNNAREYPDTFYKVMNNSGDCVYVTCNTKRKDSVREFLEEFGEIVYEEAVNKVTVMLDLNSKEWSDIYGGEDFEEVQFEVEC